MACIRVIMMRAPVDPTGWPRPMPEPFTLVISRFRPSSFSHAEILGGEGLVHFDQFEVG